MLNACRILCLALTLCLLSACGFQLRNYEPFAPPLNVLYIQSARPYSDFSKQLKAALISAKVKLVNDRQAAPITLEVIGEGSSQQLTSSSASGQTNTYTINYTVVYRLLARDGRIIQSPQTVSTLRNYSITSNQILGDSNVQTTLTSQMRREVIYLIINRLHSPQVLQSLAVVPAS